MDEFMTFVPESEKENYFLLVQFMKDLGYKLKRAKTKDINYLFTHTKVKRNILKFSVLKDSIIVKAKFYASKEYSTVFQNAIKATIEEYDFKYTGCYGCGKCKEEFMGYTYTYPDGKSYFRCGLELIELLEFNDYMLEELMELLKHQHDYYCGR